MKKYLPLVLTTAVLCLPGNMFASGLVLGDQECLERAKEKKTLVKVDLPWVIKYCAGSIQDELKEANIRISAQLESMEKRIQGVALDELRTRLLTEQDYYLLRGLIVTSYKNTEQNDLLALLEELKELQGQKYVRWLEAELIDKNIYELDDTIKVFLAERVVELATLEGPAFGFIYIDQDGFRTGSGSVAIPYFSLVHAYHTIFTVSRSLGVPLALSFADFLELLRSKGIEVEVDEGVELK